MDVLLSILWVATSLFVLYDTSFVYQYLRKMPFLNFITKVKDYERDAPAIPYSLYIQTERPGFMVELLTCRYCLGFWLALGATVAFSNWTTLPAVYLGSQLTYGLFRATDKTLQRLGDME
jgi:hypothetical protein